MRSLSIASVAAFAGGTAVVAVQYGLGLVSAGYPPVVQALTCETDDADDAAEVALTAQDGALVPVVEFPQGSTVSCRIDAPGADYATWSILGPTATTRSGPLDAQQPCQTPDDFSAQDPSRLTLSACQRFVAQRPGLYLLSVTVMLRGLPAVDRVRLLARVVAPPTTAVEPRAVRQERVAISLRLREAEVEELRSTDLSASFGEHGLLPQSRAFQRTVLRLAPNEEFVSAAFRVRSASQASAVTLSYEPQSRSVTARYTLRAGSLVDRWRGWVTGTVEVKVRRRRMARDIPLPDTDLAVPGRTVLDLPQDTDIAGAQVLIHRVGSATVAETVPGDAMTLDGIRILPTLTEDRLILDASVN